MSVSLRLSSDEKRFLASWVTQATPQQLAQVERLLTGSQPPKWNKYCPHQPWPRQQHFLSLPQTEALYGGAAAGGKSEALLMAALQYVHVPGYSALILRKTLARLRLSGGLLDRAAEWFGGTDAKWNATSQRWIFPTKGAAASISFGYLAGSRDRFRYGSSEYQLIAFDELTEFDENDYRFLFSRLRRSSDIDVPLRMRGATNPGGPGHGWVKRRFITGATPRDGGRRFTKKNRAFVPAKICDNPAVLEEEYAASLAMLHPIERARLLSGDWEVREEGLIKPSWLRRFDLSENGQQLLLYRKNDLFLTEVNLADCVRVATIDPAGTSRDKAKQRTSGMPSYSVIQVWDLFYRPWAGMALRSCWREQVGFEQLCQAIADTHQQWKPSGMWIENEKLGQATVDVLGGKLPLSTIATGGQDKVTRSVKLIHMLDHGRVFLPTVNNDWLDTLENEWLAWTGHPSEPADQIDPAAYAAQLFSRHDYGEEQGIMGFFEL